MNRQIKTILLAGVLLALLAGTGYAAYPNPVITPPSRGIELATGGQLQKRVPLSRPEILTCQAGQTETGRAEEARQPAPAEPAKPKEPPLETPDIKKREEMLEKVNLAPPLIKKEDEEKAPPEAPARGTETRPPSK
jgi:hypothetical protein